MGTQKADAIDHYAVYGGMILVGAGGATVLVTSLSMVADLIGTSTVRLSKSMCGGPNALLTEL